MAFDKGIFNRWLRGGRWMGETGTAAAPVVTSQQDSTSGIFFPEAGVVGISASGVEIMRVTPTGVQETGGLRAESTQSRQWVPGRVWGSQFVDSVADASQFDVVNLTYGVDGSVPVVRATTPANISTFLTKEHLQDFNVRMRYKAAAAGGQVLADSLHYCLGRHSHILNRSVYALDGFNPLSGFLWARSMIAGTSGTAAAEFLNKTTLSPVVDSTNTTAYRYLELEVTDNLMKVRTWIEGQNIPVWQMRRLSRESIFTVDEPGPGPAGFGIHLAGAAVQEVVVTELVRRDSNILRNPVVETIDHSTSLPVYWNRNRAPVSGESIDVQSVADWHGRVRPALHFVSLGTGNPGPCWTQNVYVKRGKNVALARHLVHPFSPIGPEIEIVCRSKGQGVQNAVPSSLYEGLGLAACFVIKYYAADTGAELGVLENPAANVHYIYLGPARGGLGTWNWYETRYRMQIVDWERVMYVVFTLGLHDATSIGELWIMDPHVKSVG